MLCLDVCGFTIGNSSMGGGERGFLRIVPQLLLLSSASSYLVASVAYRAGRMRVKVGAASRCRDQADA